MVPILMIVLIIKSSDCALPLEQMLSSGCSAANRPLGSRTTTHLYPYFSLNLYCICIRSFLYLPRIDYHFVPMIAQFERTMTFLSFRLSPIDQVLAKSAATEETEEEAD